MGQILGFNDFRCLHSIPNILTPTIVTWLALPKAGQDENGWDDKAENENTIMDNGENENTIGENGDTITIGQAPV